MRGRTECIVLELGEGLLGGTLSGEKLERILNEQAAQGGRPKTITAAEVKGRVGPDGVDGPVVTYEGELE